MFAWVIFIGIGLLLFASFAALIHSFSPLARFSFLQIQKLRLPLILTILLAFVGFLSLFTPLLDHASKTFIVFYCLAEAFLFMICAECSYYIVRRAFLKKVLIGSSALIGSFFLALLILSFHFKDIPESSLAIYIHVGAPALAITPIGYI